MWTSISFSWGEILLANLAWRQCPLQHVLVLYLEGIKFTYSGAKKRA